MLEAEEGLVLLTCCGAGLAFTECQVPVPFSFLDINNGVINKDEASCLSLQTLDSVH